LRRQQFKIVGKGRCYFGKIIRWMAGRCIAVSKPKNKVSFSDQFWFIFDADKLHLSSTSFSITLKRCCYFKFTNL
jgi:hypothetical protein